jgi:nucleoside-diphosphate-sugar epimerase
VTDREHRPILVTGGTGTLGRLVVPRLQDAGRKVAGPRVYEIRGGERSYSRRAALVD